MRASHQEKFFPRRLQSGVSLIELMVALVIASLLGIGLVQIFAGTRAAFNSNSALARAQENSRFAVGFIESDLRMIGHLGLSNEQGYQAGNIFNHLSSDGRSNSVNTPFLYRMHLPVQGYGFTGTEVMGVEYEMPDAPAAGASAAAWTPVIPSELALLSGSNKAVAGSDVLLLRFLSAESASLQDITGDPTVASNVGLDGAILWDNTQTGSGEFLKDGGVFALTNYSLLSLFYVRPTSTGVADASQGGINLVGWPAVAARFDEPDAYGQGSSLYRYEVSAYYVGLSETHDEPSLFRKRLDNEGNLGPAEELVPGVDMMQVTYGVVDTATRSGDQPTRYLTAAGIEAGTWRPTAEQRWADVVAVRVGLLMRSNQPAGSAVEVNFVRTVGGMEIMPPDDRRLRYVYETQVALRNRSRG
ncbi:MAG: PilW family protein [Lysobacteraceae bacterium]